MAELVERITVSPEQCGGRPCIRGMRIRVIDVLDLLAAGLTQQQVLNDCRISKRKISRPVFASPAAGSITQSSLREDLDRRADFS